jgi:pSer/pThr/pTyr-binding forkhead associated (FHA) protein
MKFCDKCGLRLEEDTPECSNCKNMSLLDHEEIVSPYSTGEITNITEFKKSIKKKSAKSETSEPKSKVPEQYARLSVIKGGTDGREFPINTDICNIGRWDPSLKSHPEIDLSDEDIDAKVSRLHARIIRKPEGYYIEDIGSRNGTFLNREFRLVQGIEYSLKDNDEVIIGHIFFKFQLG